MKKFLGKTASHWLQKYYLAPDHPLKLRLWYAVWRLLGSPYVTIPYAGRGWLAVHLEDWLQRKIFTDGEYEAEVWRALEPYCDEDEVVWDVGAHIGSFSVRAGLHPRVREVHAFEPSVAQGRVLKHNLSLNRGRYQYHPFALSNEAEQRALYHGLPGNTGQSSLATAVTAQTSQVYCIEADRLIFNDGVPAPTLLKLDVEGWETRVLQGASRLLVECPPKAIVFEAESDRNGRCLEGGIQQLLEENGYEISHLPRPSKEIERRENYVAVLRGGSRPKGTQNA
jgi:FkbM family methyltransferase